jgi:hypothetical protein
VRSLRRWRPRLPRQSRLNYSRHRPGEAPARQGHCRLTRRPRRPDRYGQRPFQLHHARQFQRMLLHPSRGEGRDGLSQKRPKPRRKPPSGGISLTRLSLSKFQRRSIPAARRISTPLVAMEPIVDHRMSPRFRLLAVAGYNFRNAFNITGMNGYSPVVPFNPGADSVPYSSVFHRGALRSD